MSRMDCQSLRQRQQREEKTASVMEMRRCLTKACFVRIRPLTAAVLPSLKRNMVKDLINRGKAAVDAEESPSDAGHEPTEHSSSEGVQHVPLKVNVRFKPLRERPVLLTNQDLKEALSFEMLYDEDVREASRTFQGYLSKADSYSGCMLAKKNLHQSQPARATGVLTHRPEEDEESSLPFRPFKTSLREPEATVETKFFALLACINAGQADCLQPLAPPPAPMKTARLDEFDSDSDYNKSLRSEDELQSVAEVSTSCPPVSVSEKATQTVSQKETSCPPVSVSEKAIQTVSQKESKKETFADLRSLAKVSQIMLASLVIFYSSGTERDRPHARGTASRRRRGGEGGRGPERRRQDGEGAVSTRNHELAGDQGQEVAQAEEEEE